MERIHRTTASYPLTSRGIHVTRKLKLLQPIRIKAHTINIATLSNE